MASNRNDDTSSGPSYEQRTKRNFFELLRDLFTYISRYILPGARLPLLGRLNQQASPENQQARAIKESSRILEDITGSPKGYPLQSGSGWAKNKRIPRLYYINNNQTILIILQGDITRTKVDAIVNAANEHMTGGSGVDGMIHRAAGDELYKACIAHKQISKGVRLPTGHSRILLSYNMSSTTYHIINTAGPMYSSYKAKQCAADLSSCYKTAIALANLYDLESIGFTAISCGIFGYPTNDGAGVALRTVNEYADSLPVVVFVLWDDHIYDAWVQKVEELKFTPFNPESTTTTTNSTKPSIDNDQEETIQNPTVNDDRPESSPKLTSPATGLSAQNKEEKTPEIVYENLIQKLPSVPSESSDTQKTELMDHNDNSMDTDQPLTTQKTVEMTNVNSETEDSTTNANSETVDSTTNDNSEQQPAQEGINKLESKKEDLTTNDNSEQPAQEGVDKSEGEKAKLDTVQNESHPSATADILENVN